MAEDQSRVLLITYLIENVHKYMAGVRVGSNRFTGFIYKKQEKKKIL